MPVVREAAERYGVDIRDVIVGVSEVDLVHVSAELADTVARELSERGAQERRVGRRTGRTYFAVGAPSLPETIEEQSGRIASEMRALGSKTHKTTVLAVAAWPGGTGWRFNHVRQSDGLIAGAVEVKSEEQARCVASAFDGQVDMLAVDGGGAHDRAWLRTLVSACTSRSTLVSYDDARAQDTSIELLVRSLLPDVPRPTLVLFGSGARAEAVGHWLNVSTSLEVRLPGDSSADDAGGAQVVVGLAPDSVGVEEIEALAASARLIVDAGPGSIDSVAIGAGSDEGLTFVRADMRAGLVGELTAALEGRELVEHAMGRSTLAGVDVVAGGSLGELGTIVVDSIDYPTAVVGVADGHGGLLPESDYRSFAEEVAAVRREVSRIRFGV
jgi:hypothetical protein